MINLLWEFHCAWNLQYFGIGDPINRAAVEAAASQRKVAEILRWLSQDVKAMKHNQRS